MDADYEKKILELKSKIKSFPDFPKPGILFWDIFSAISDGATCKILQDLLVKTVKVKFPEVEAVIGLESRGFLFSFSLAAELGIGCLPVRKKGKLPGEVVSYKYDLEYGSDILEIQKNAIRPGQKCLIIDDLMATGGSLTAASELLKTCGADVIGCLLVIELTSLRGRDSIPKGIPVHSLIKVGPLIKVVHNDDCKNSLKGSGLEGGRCILRIAVLRNIARRDHLPRKSGAVTFIPVP